tara:strand:+ start:24 stop:521 length:498 start_codon:yes stop_codon:yes gene_type:complete
VENLRVKGQSPEIKFERIWAVPNKQTFTVPKIKKFLKSKKHGMVLDLFSYPFDKDVLEKLKVVKSESIDVLLFDPPYNEQMYKEHYENKGSSIYNSVYAKKLKYEVSRVVKPGGIIIKFGWNSTRINSNFEITEIYLISHGGYNLASHDTICRVQKKVMGDILNC